jgi:uncharacterized protein YneF (UPF0154 family)
MTTIEMAVIFTIVYGFAAGIYIGRKTSKAKYWKERCLSAEEIISISGIVNCEGYDNWQSLKKQQP